MIDISSQNPLKNPTLPIDVYLNLYKANNRLLHDLEEKLSKLHLTLGRLCLLVSLKFSEEPKLPSELGDDLAVTRANISNLLRSLEKLGMIKREFNLSDRRQILVSITEKGINAVDAAWPIYEEVMFNKMQHLSEKEKLNLRDLLYKLGDTKNE